MLVICAFALKPAARTPPVTKTPKTIVLMVATLGGQSKMLYGALSDLKGGTKDRGRGTGDEEKGLTSEWINDEVVIINQPEAAGLSSP